MKTTTRCSPNAGTVSMNFSSLGISKVGPEILRRMRNSTFNGLTGRFRLFNGQLRASVFEVFNVVGPTEQVIGYWTRKHGLSRKVCIYSLLPPQVFPFKVFPTTFHYYLIGPKQIQIKSKSFVAKDILNDIIIIIFYPDTRSQTDPTNQKKGIQLRYMTSKHQDGQVEPEGSPRAG